MSNPARRNSAKVLELYPMIGSTALFMNHVRGSVPVAATNGKQVLLGERFFGLTESERNGVMLHEYLHCVLSHPQRAALLRMKEGNRYSPSGFNVAADALINHTIRAEARDRPLIRLPEGAIAIEKLRTDLQALGIIKQGDLDPASSTVEEIYHALMKAKDLQEAMGLQSPGSDASEGLDSKQQKALERIRALLDEEPDLHAAEGTAEELQEKIREQTARLEQARKAYGSKSGSLVERISGDIPRGEVPWESAFRTISAKHLSRTRQKSNRKPSGSMLSHEALGGARFWEPGRTRTPQPKALVIADSSASISMENYRTFLGELNGMRRRTNARLLFATADTQIQTLDEINETTALRDLTFNGRGGTNFVEPLRKAEELGVDLVIYMTDMDGPFPAKCQVPVIWAVPRERKPKTPPFGRVLSV